tara:strand:+ start:2176 stop:3309 length:1134 start_codon:yes stop_codon:yes gene_type:complete
MMNDIDDEWNRFQLGEDIDFGVVKDDANTSELDDNIVAPECEPLYISTTTKVLYLNQSIDIENIFWKIPIIDYFKPCIGIVKKQMKIVSKTPEEYEMYKEKLKEQSYYRENIIKEIHNPTARRVKFKDERKITIGISKKDIMNCRGKVKNAFYNCFALIFRFMYKNVYKEIHVKVFNTGKLEIPGVICEELLDMVKKSIIDFLQPHIENKMEFIVLNKEENVLINSNFKCGYFIDRDKLYMILKDNKYCIETAYDPTSYPGIKCKFYFNNHKQFDVDVQKGQIEEEDRNMKLSELDDNNKYTEVSFMIFRTGSCLIVGNCTEKILRFVYNFIKNMLETEYMNIRTVADVTNVKEKKIKQRKKTINVTSDYYVNNIIK